MRKGAESGGVTVQAIAGNALRDWASAASPFEAVSESPVVILYFAYDNPKPLQRGLYGSHVVGNV